METALETAVWLEAFKRSKNAIVIGEEASRKALQAKCKALDCHLQI